jgi:hypothetical protein
MGFGMQVVGQKCLKVDSDVFKKRDYSRNSSCHKGSISMFQRVQNKIMIKINIYTSINNYENRHSVI